MQPLFKIETTMGDIVVELYQDKAPLTVANFCRYVNNNHYVSTIFHRVIPGFMIQGGGYKVDMVKNKRYEPIRNEAGNGLTNKRGTLAMARHDEVDSATASFFINLIDNEQLDHAGDSPEEFGYCVFGKVVKGMDVVDNIGSVATTSTASDDNVPVVPVYITKVSSVPR